jgi:hypothetical protein
MSKGISAAFCGGILSHGRMLILQQRDTPIDTF